MCLKRANDVTKETFAGLGTEQGVCCGKARLAWLQGREAGHGRAVSPEGCPGGVRGTAAPCAACLRHLCRWGVCEKLFQAWPGCEAGCRAKLDCRCFPPRTCCLPVDESYPAKGCCWVCDTRHRLFISLVEDELCWPALPLLGWLRAWGIGLESEQMVTVTGDTCQAQADCPRVP